MRARRGSAALEFVVVAPVLLMLSLGATDVVMLMRAQLRADAAAQQLGQLVSQCNRIAAPGDLEQFWAYAQRIVGSAGTVTGAGATGSVVLTAVGQVEGANQVAWQYRAGAAGPASVMGSGAALPGGATVPPGQTMFVVEVYLQRDEWVMAAGLMGPGTRRTLSGVALFLTRVADAAALLAPPEANTQPACTA